MSRKQVASDKASGKKGEKESNRIYKHKLYLKINGEYRFVEFESDTKNIRTITRDTIIETNDWHGTR